MKKVYEYERLPIGAPITARKISRHVSGGRIHWHEEIEILYFTQGKAVTACNLQNIAVQKGDIVLVNGNEPHIGIVSEHDSAFYCIHFNVSFFHNFIGNEYLLFQNLIQDEECKRILDELLKSIHKNDYQNKIKTQRLAFEFFTILSDKYVKSILSEAEYKKQFKKIDTFHEMITYIHKHYTENLTVSGIAEQFFISPSYFAHFFKSKAQKSVIEYINELRVSHAKSLLEKEGCSIGSVAFEVGFNDLNYFCRKFKSLTGKTPGEYKKYFQ